MSDLTLCLITKGRADYLDLLLKSFAHALEYDQIRILIILNGVEDKIADQFQEWSQMHSHKVDLHAFAENDVRLSRYWSLILGIQTKWVAFPSDDDLLDPSFFDRWDIFEKSHSLSGAVATPLEIIDQYGEKTGATRHPSFNPNSDISEYSAKAFSECPFLWPGLIIQISALPKDIPDTRYVIDWWMGLHLIFTTKVEVSKYILVNYRVHEMQESAVASLARKNLEATVHLGNFINDETFAGWIKARSPEEVINFMQFLFKYPPLYGDLKFSSEIVSVIAQKVKSLREEKEVRLSSLLINALAHDVLINEDQLVFFGGQVEDLKNRASRTNFNLVFSKHTCSNLESRLGLAQMNNNAFPTVVVGCNHSNASPSDISLDCDALGGPRVLVDKLLFEVENHFKSKELFQRSVSPFEYSIIRKLRLLKVRIPRWLIWAIQGRLRR